MIYPSISVVIPSYNQGKFIERTLLSILNQSYPGEIQLIVSDGGSNDETVDVLRKYSDKITWWSERDNGFVDAVTKGFDVATGEILAIQSSDDYYFEDAFIKLVQGFEKYPDASLISGSDIFIDLDYNIVHHQLHFGEISPHSILFNATPSQHATFFKREYYDIVKGLRIEVDTCADIDLWYRITHFRRGHYIQDYVAAYQFHPNQRTRTLSTWEEQIERMVSLCENEERYGNLYKLTDNEKFQLKIFWKFTWLGENSKDGDALIELANSYVKDLSRFDERNRQLIKERATIKIPIEQQINTRKGSNYNNYMNDILNRLKNKFRSIISKPSKENIESIENAYLNQDLYWWKH